MTFEHEGLLFWCYTGRQGTLKANKPPILSHLKTVESEVGIVERYHHGE